VLHGRRTSLTLWFWGAYLVATHRGVSSSHLQVDLEEFVFRFSRRSSPMAAFEAPAPVRNLHSPTTYEQIPGGIRQRPESTDMQLTTKSR
jgi:hypothetical protein